MSSFPQANLRFFGCHQTGEDLAALQRAIVNFLRIENQFVGRCDPYPNDKVCKRWNWEKEQLFVYNGQTILFYQKLKSTHIETRLMSEIEINGEQLPYYKARSKMRKILKEIADQPYNLYTKLL